ncbi:MAG: UDP-N-acetylmuramoyl-L-alanine--D-glutamate ligase [Chloroflexi bacterium]|nr:UDP-N-acetylmuramoyl-L-alanine--D-glutamate ligase [Chloroflexota bacterium]
MMKTDWTGKRVLIIGGARQGLAAARWLARHSAQVTINDRRPPEEMASARREMAGIQLVWALGSHPVALLDSADFVVISGGVPLTNPIAAGALARGIPLTNDTQIFLEQAPCKIIGITGSAGKTTTTTLVGRMAKSALGDKAVVGGNIGDPLLNHVDQMTAEHLAILEISSFQLEQMLLSPTLAAILNITSNHLDRHGSIEAYAAAKYRLIQFQGPRDCAVLGRDDPGAWRLRESVKGELLSFGMSPLPAGGQGVFVRDGLIIHSAAGRETTLLDAAEIQLRGGHNRLNVLAACAIACAAGLQPDTIRAGVAGFGGVPHRLELVRQVNGVCWYNDSIATAPERTMAAIRSFEEPLVLLLGGRDKQLPWQDLAALIRQRVDHVILFGEAAGKIQAALGKPASGQRPYTLEQCTSLAEAVQVAAGVATMGDVVLFSPGGASFDEFRDFEDRGERFIQWVSELS